MQILRCSYISESSAPFRSTQHVLENTGSSYCHQAKKARSEYRNVCQKNRRIQCLTQRKYACNTKNAAHVKTLLFKEKNSWYFRIPFNQGHLNYTAIVTLDLHHPPALQTMENNRSKAVLTEAILFYYCSETKAVSVSSPL